MLKELLNKLPKPRSSPSLPTKEPSVNDLLDIAVDHRYEVQTISKFLYGLVYLSDRVQIPRKTVRAALEKAWDQYDTERVIEDEDIADVRKILRGK